MAVARNLAGMRFGRLLVESRGPNVGAWKSVSWLCLCDCGERASVLSNNLWRNHTTSCGCLKTEAVPPSPEYRRIKEAPPPCGCGCGGAVRRSNHGARWNKYIDGHNAGRADMPRGATHYRWKGGRTVSDGRARVLRPEHPRASKIGYVYNYVLVAEARYGRPVLAHEDVHHINGDKSDDRPENLIILDKAEHTRLHARERRARRLMPHR